MKRYLLLITIISILVFTFGGCVLPKDEPSQHTDEIPTAPETPPEVPPCGEVSLGPEIEIAGSTNKDYYVPGEQVEIEISVRNCNSFPITLDPFPPEVEIWLPHLDMLVKNQELIRVLETESEEINLAADETYNYYFTWDQKNTDGVQVPSGRYYLAKVYLKASGQGGTQGVGNIYAHILIQHPQGAMEKTIEVNQSQTIDNLTFTWREEEICTDITVTLEKIESFTMGTRIFALASSPHYLIGDPETHWDRMRPPWNEEVYAQIIVDGLLMYDGIRPQATGFHEEGVHYIWGEHQFLDPIPSDAKELTFSVTRWGDWEGPWEFQVPLN